MAIMFVRAQVISRGAGRSIVSAAAYRHRARMMDEQAGTSFSYRGGAAELKHEELALPDQVPLSYTATSTYDVWADAALGAPLDTKINRSVVANVGAGAASIPLLPVLTIDVAEDQASVQDAADRVNPMIRNWLDMHRAKK